MKSNVYVKEEHNLVVAFSLTASHGYEYEE